LILLLWEALGQEATEDSSAAHRLRGELPLSRWSDERVREGYGAGPVDGGVGSPHRLGATLAFEHYDPPDPSCENSASYWAQHSELGRAIRDAVSGLVALRLDPAPAPQGDALWLS
jgi:hypothetical protein